MNKQLKTNIWNITLLSLLVLFSVKLSAQDIIYEQNFNNVNSGMIPVNNSNQDGWLVNGQTTTVLGQYSHRTGIHNGGQAIAGKSLGVSFYDGSILYTSFGGQYVSCNYDSSFDLAAFRKVPSTGYENITMEFKWKGAGEQFNSQWVDYGQVGYSTTGGAPFTWLTTGGQTGN